jgi:hypothetical protein
MAIFIDINFGGQSRSRGIRGRLCGKKMKKIGSAQ